MTNDKGEIRYGIRFSVLSCLLDSLLHAVSQNIPFELGFHPDCCKVGYPFDSGSHKMLWSRESIYQEANPEVTALARRGAA